MCDNKLLFYKEIGKKLKSIKTVNGSDDNKKILNLFQEKLRGNDRDMQRENNALISEIDEVNNFSIERKTVDIAICKLKEGIDHSNRHSSHIKKTSTALREFSCKMFDFFLRHNYIPKKMLHGKIRPRMKDNIVCKA